MQRRDALRLLLSGAVLPALSPEAFALFRGAHPGQGYSPRTLSAHHFATVSAMTDLIIPATDTPGAKGAKVPEFIDLILTEWATEEERAHFLAGIDGVDEKSGELFGKNFVEASPPQQTALLEEMDDTAIAELNRAERVELPKHERDTQLKGDFWVAFKGITLHGYYTSEIGFTQELKLEIIPGAQHGCIPVGPGMGEA